MKIGLFLCDCGKNISGVIDNQELIDHFSDKESYPDVHILREQYLCSELGLSHIIEEIKDQEIERIVIAACSFKLHGQLFRKTIEQAGINRFLISFANIREQNSWVHPNEPLKATQKAIDQINMAIEQVKLLEPLEIQYAEITPATLVIGGGISGIKAAMVIANAGYKVYLVEKDLTIGGHMALFDKTFPTLDCSICILGPLMSEANDHPNIELLTYSEVKKVDGYVGNFEVSIEKKPRFIIEDECVGCFDICREVCPIDIEDTFYPRKAIDVPYPQAIPLYPNIMEEYCVGCRACEQACDRDAIDFDQTTQTIKIKVGSIIVATGFKTFDPSLLAELNYQKYPDVITTMEMERLLNNDGPTVGKVVKPSDGKVPKKVGFVLCVGSRNKKINHEYCSQVCCNASIKQAILIKKQNPEIEITIYYTDIRAVGKNCEEFYNRAREDFGVNFVKSNIASIVKSDLSDQLLIRGEDVIDDTLFEHKVDLAILAVGIEPAENTRYLSQKLNISQDTYGFLLEKHLKVKPSESSVSGIYLAGAIQGPKDIPSSIAQAESAAAKSIALIAAGKVELDPHIVYCDQEKCDLCRLCLDVCIYNALKIEDKQLKIIQANCSGCGACAAMCPNNALYIPGFRRDQIKTQINSALTIKKEFPLIIAFLCNWCSYMGADLAGTSKLTYPTNVRTIHVMCTAMIDPALIFEAFFKGADGVIITGCHEQDCHYDTGFLKAKKRYASIKEMLTEMGINENRLQIESISAGEGEKFAKLIREFTETIKNLGTIKPEEYKRALSVETKEVEKARLDEI
ncbi:MAG: hydrogenase iron-sulfur subunit [Candidatus Lokiarchaeota archaeon]|nr:hydrogenase iron-sulfur subunit [Candidatus Lokiarchaeota archaeon]MBD3337637.1 hydrogenase iron-sulfur subunit [Candidatus Lokiarchaeota archaeon]